MPGPAALAQQAVRAVKHGTAGGVDDDIEPARGRAGTPGRGADEAVRGRASRTKPASAIPGLLADAIDDPAAAVVVRQGISVVRDLTLTAGPAADGMITSSHR